MRITRAIILCRQHLSRIRFPKATRTADTNQTVIFAYALIHKADQASLIHIFWSGNPCKTHIARIHIHPHIQPLFEVRRVKSTIFVIIKKMVEISLYLLYRESGTRGVEQEKEGTSLQSPNLLAMSSVFNS